MKAKVTQFSHNSLLNVGGKVLDLSQPRVMGILNLTPDSFYAGSRISSTEDLLERAGQMLEQGASLLDLGGYSSRPGARDISPQQEADRVLPAVELLRKHLPQALLSVDTFRASVAEAAVQSGAHLINDISGGELDERMFATVARLQVPYILMHMRGTPHTMSQLNHYDDILSELIDYFSLRLNQLRELGVKDIVIDPGFGFAKNREQNFFLLKKLSAFRCLNAPILVGISRKSLIYKTLECEPQQAVNGTTVLNTLALSQGASILRVHDVREAAEAVSLVDKTFF